MERGILYILLIVFLLLIPVLFRNPYHLGVITFMLINALLAASCWFIMATGQVTLGHAGFAAIGGYLSAALVARYGMGSWWSLLIAMMAAGIVALIVGYVTLRIKGIYFIVATLALGEVIRIVFGAWDDPFGGLVGIMNLPTPNRLVIPGLLAISFGSKVSLYYLTLVLVLIGILLMHRLSRSAMGLVFRGICLADDLAENIGINIMKYKVLAFVVGATFAGMGGVLYTYNVGSIQPSSFTLVQSATYLVYVAVGGRLCCWTHLGCPGSQHPFGVFETHQRIRTDRLRADSHRRRPILEEWINRARADAAASAPRFDSRYRQAESDGRVALSQNLNGWEEVCIMVKFASQLSYGTGMQEWQERINTTRMRKDGPTG